MVNSSKTPTGKTSKGKVSIYVDKGRIKARLPRQYFGGEQPRIALGMDADKTNMARAQRLAERMTLDLQDGCFDETLAKYGIVADLKLKSESATLTSDGQLPPKPELSLMEVWDMYCEYRKHELSVTTYQLKYLGIYSRFISDAIEAVGCEDALKIRNWLVENRSLSDVKTCLSSLSKAHKVAIRQKLTNTDPFDGIAEELNIRKGAKAIEEGSETEDDSDILNPSKAYTFKEAQSILEYIENNNKIKHWHTFVKFKFLTGCRTGEAIGFKWKDIKWENECIIFIRTWNRGCKIFKKTKNERPRKFPMPKDGELWNLLKSIPQGELDSTVFQGKTGNIINSAHFATVWKGLPERKRKGIIPELIKQGKLSKYLPPYNTRHTFITHQIFDLGRDEQIVNAWCEHSQETSRKHYQNITSKAMQINPELPANQQSHQQSELDLLKEQLRQQQELINKLLHDRDK